MLVSWCNLNLSVILGVYLFTHINSAWRAGIYKDATHTYYAHISILLIKMYHLSSACIYRCFQLDCNPHILHTCFCLTHNTFRGHPQVAESLGLAHMLEATLLSLADAQSNHGSEKGGTSCHDGGGGGGGGGGGNGEMVSVGCSSIGALARTQEQAGNGLYAYADAQGMLTALLCEGSAHHTRRCMGYGYVCVCGGGGG